MKTKKLFIPLFIMLIILSTAVFPDLNAAEAITDKILRLHILADSDSVYDQNIKLELKDYFLENSKDIFVGDDIDENIELAKKNIHNMKSICNSFLEEKGYNKEVNISVCEEFFDTRVYDDFTLPAGVYNTVKIKIGQGKGHNWWCIVFPSVCISACSDTMSNYLSEDELALVEKGYSPKFKIIEIYQRIKEYAAGNN